MGAADGSVDESSTANHSAGDSEVQGGLPADLQTVPKSESIVAVGAIEVIPGTAVTDAGAHDVYVLQIIGIGRASKNVGKTMIVLTTEQIKALSAAIGRVV